MREDVEESETDDTRRSGRAERNRRIAAALSASPGNAEGLQTLNFTSFPFIRPSVRTGAPFPKEKGITLETA